MADASRQSKPLPAANPVSEFIGELGLPRLLIAVFVAVLFVVAAVTHMDLASLVTDSLLRVGRNGLLVLALHWLALNRGRLKELAGG